MEHILKKLSDNDIVWRKIALKICGDKSIADDLVNDMYVKMYSLDKKEYNTHYVSYMIYHLFIDYLRHKKKTIPLDNIKVKNIEDNTTELRTEINDILNEIGFFDREILLHTHEKSLRKTSEALNMSHVKLHYQKQKAISKLKETNGFKKLKNERDRL